MTLQELFETFDKKIKLDYKGDKNLKEKQILLLRNLKEGINKAFSDTNPPRYEFFNQGSYLLQTGVKPIGREDDYDIDIGLQFYFHRNKFTAKDCKMRIVEALKHPTRGIKRRRSCVTIQYIEDQEKAFHVDLAIYAHQSCNNGHSYLAQAPVSDADDVWVVSEPLKLKAVLENRLGTYKYDTEDKNQFLRVIRVLKRWKDVKFPSDDSSRPTGIAMTICAWKWFEIYKNEAQYNDLSALEYLTSQMLTAFKKENKPFIALPVKPNNDLFEKMNTNGHQNFIKELEKLNDVLKSVKEMNDLNKISEILMTELGENFPKPY